MEKNLTPEEEKLLIVINKAIDSAKTGWIEARFDTEKFIPLIARVKKEAMEEGLSEGGAILATRIGIGQAEMIRKGDRKVS